LLAGQRVEGLPDGVRADMGVFVAEDADVGPSTFLGAGTCVGQNVVVGANCVLENCIVYDDATIGPGSVLRNAIVGEGARLGPRTTILSGACEVRVGDEVVVLDDFGAVIGEGATLAGANLVLPGSIVGNHTTVAPGARVAGTTPDHALVVGGGA